MKLSHCQIKMLDVVFLDIGVTFTIVQRPHYRLNKVWSWYGLHVHSCTLWLRPRTPPPAFGLIYEGAIGQPR
jgi:hypothetical protein